MSGSNPSHKVGRNVREGNPSHELGRKGLRTEHREDQQGPQISSARLRSSYREEGDSGGRRQDLEAMR
jgi:hypothetical protein